MKYLYQIAYQLIKVYWRLFKPITAGVRILLVQDKSVVLVKHTYDDAWYFPGGGLKRGETLAAAAHREVKEEVSGIMNDLRLLGIYTNYSQVKTDHVVVFVSEDFSWHPKADKREIEQVAQFSLDQLPPNLSDGSRRRLDDYLNQLPVQTGLW